MPLFGPEADGPGLHGAAGANAPPRPRQATATRKRPQAPQAAAAGQDFQSVAEVAVAAQLGTLTYGVPQALQLLVQPGTRVNVPLRGRVEVGLVIATGDIAACPLDVARLRPVLACLDATPLPADLLATVRFLARYYHAPLGLAVRTALSAPLRRTGLGDDQTREKLQPWVSATWLRPWPDDLSRAEVRLMHRIEAEGSLPVADLRRKQPDEPKIQASGTVLEGLAARGLVRLWQERVLRDPLGLRTPVPPDQAPQLHPAQIAALAAMSQDLRANRYGAHLLHGVTGSGKTEVYLHLIGAALELGRGAIVLVPEIALTPQLVQRFRARFGEQVAALHSGMSDGERLDAFDRIRSGSARIVVGPRSALFAPVPRLGVVVVDECHDSSFKQQSGLRYHARDLALVRAQSAAAVCVLGSATPGCEEVFLVQTGRISAQRMPERAMSAQLPALATIDLRTAERARDPDTPERPSLLSLELLDNMAQVVQRGEQVMLLHNRRGFATSMLCAACGQAVECPECAVALTWHRGHGRLRCHWCDLSLPDAMPCPHCGGRNLIGIGSGTERIEATISRHLGAVRVARLDRDTAAGQRLIDTLERFRRGEIDILVGTQMLAKGHDFPAVTLVGVVLAETGLAVPDFRASERTFQLLTQVAGRAGRAERPGRVLVQTFQPDHFAIAAALRSDYEGFSSAELVARQHTGYPPWTHLALIEMRHADAEVARSALQAAVLALREWGADVRGPVLAAVARTRGIWRVHALLRSHTRPELHALLARWTRELLPLVPGGVDVTLDVDPQGLA